MLTENDGQKMRKYAESHAPLRRNSSTGDVGSVAAFLSSDLAASVTGQTIYGTLLVCSDGKSNSALTKHSAAKWTCSGRWLERYGSVREKRVIEYREMQRCRNGIGAWIVCH
jgi:hypothetical protein